MYLRSQTVKPGDGVEDVEIKVVPLLFLVCRSIREVHISINLIENVVHLEVDIQDVGSVPFISVRTLTIRMDFMQGRKLVGNLAKSSEPVVDVCLRTMHL